MDWAEDGVERGRAQVLVLTLEGQADYRRKGWHFV